MIAITKVETISGQCNITYDRQRNPKIDRELNNMLGIVRKDSQGAMLGLIERAEDDALQDGVKLGQVLAASGVASYEDFKSRVKQMLEECSPDDLTEELAKFLMEDNDDE